MTSTSERIWTSDPPDSDGWWLFAENGEPSVQRILVRRGTVASDAEWAEETGREPSDVMCWNYWEGTSVADMTNGKYTTGVWSRESHQLVSRVPSDQEGR